MGAPSVGVISEADVCVIFEKEFTQQWVVVACSL